MKKKANEKEIKKRKISLMICIINQSRDLIFVGLITLFNGISTTFVGRLMQKLSL